MSETLTSEGEVRIKAANLPAPTPVPTWAFRNRLTESALVGTDYTYVTGPVLTLETGVLLTLQSNAWLVIVG